MLLKETATEAVKDAYAALKNRILERYPDVDLSVDKLEKEPTAASQAVVAEDLEREGASDDIELARLARNVVERIQEQQAPDLARAISVEPKALDEANVTLTTLRSGESDNGVQIDDPTVGVAVGSLEGSPISISSIHVGPTAEEITAAYERGLKDADERRAKKGNADNPSIIASGVKPPRLADYIAADGWTLIDNLGYRRYVKALHAFISDPRTIAPLCISVQAPWGGGKTSIMRMVQLRLDRRALELDSPDAVKAWDADEAARKGESTPPSPRHSVNQLQDDAAQTIGQLQIGEVLKLLSAWKKTAEPDVKVKLDVADPTSNTCITVWFNAWKYDATNQVWAGLADAIIAQITRRVSLEQREKIFLQLRLSRIDAEKVRSKIYDRIYRLALQNVGPQVLAWGGGVVTGVLTALVGAAAHEQYMGLAGVAVAVTTAAAGFFKARDGYDKAKHEVSDEKAATTLTELMTMPSYDAEIGFLHKVDSDLRRVLALVPEDYWPIVIFIDDLDRSSPTKVAQVMEAVNLFLAGEFARCMFVIGMDSEMVAASLDVAHKDVINALPQDARIPVGWRFMDKFVQLPFVVPPISASDVRSFSRSLLITPERRKLISQTATEAMADANTISEETITGARTHALKIGLSAEEVSEVISEVRSAQERDAQARAIAEFDDDRDDVRAVIEQGVQYFSGNPRELKRLLNAFRSLSMGMRPLV